MKLSYKINKYYYKKFKVILKLCNYKILDFYLFINIVYKSLYKKLFINCLQVYYFIYLNFINIKNINY